MYAPRHSFGVSNFATNLIHKVPFTDINSQLIKKNMFISRGSRHNKNCPPHFHSLDFFNFFIVQGKPNK